MLGRNRLVVLVSVVLLGIASYQPLTRGYIAANIGTLFSWSGASQPWSGSTQVATCGDFHTYIRNDGTACPSNVAGLLNGFATAHAVNQVTHTVLANGTFTGGNFTSWTSSNTGSCNGSVFAGYNSTDQDNDGGLAYGSSGSCTSGMTIALSQTVTVGTSPTAQTYSFWYKAPQVLFGDATNCTQGVGTASLTLVVHGTTVATITPSLDGAWHRVSGTMSALVTGSNTVTVNASLAGANGQNSRYNPKIQFFTCLPAQTVSQPMSLDDFVITAVW